MFGNRYTKYQHSIFIWRRDPSKRIITRMEMLYITRMEMLYIMVPATTATPLRMRFLRRLSNCRL